MSLVRSRTLASLLFAVYGFCAVAGPAGLHELVPHEHGHELAGVANVDRAHGAGHAGHRHDHDHHGAGHTHGGHEHCHAHQPPEHAHEESSQPGSHSHFPGESDDCLACQFMATAARAISPPAIETTTELLAELILPASPTHHLPATLSISIRGPPAAGLHSV